jgi:hypothetical protein
VALDATLDARWRAETSPTRFDARRSSLPWKSRLGEKVDESSCGDAVALGTGRGPAPTELTADPAAPAKLDSVYELCPLASTYVSAKMR